MRVLDTRCQRYPLTPGRHLRGAAYAECRVGGARFLLAGSHLSTDPAERPAQAAAFKRELAAADLPVVAGADLNEGPDGPAWATVGEGLTDAAVAADRADRHTYSCADPRRRIDAVFVDPRITVVDYDVVDTPQTRRASDHFPSWSTCCCRPPADRPGASDPPQGLDKPVGLPEGFRSDRHSCRT